LAPGTRAEYSNYGFVLLGEVIERVSGQTYYDYVADHVFAPAGMTDAGYPNRESRQGVATGMTTYYGEEDAPISNIEVLPWRGMPDGGGVASANDMLKFFNAMQAGTLLSAAMFELATNGGETPWYGTGFVTGSMPYRSWRHGGNSYGMDVAIHYYPAVNSTFICLATRDMACNRLIWAWVPKVHGSTD
jgi:CubicO group peptidase (beta-lactamase class C family)